MRITLLIVSFVLCTAVETAAQDFQKTDIIGSWVSNEDVKYVLKADKAVITEFYDGEVTGSYNYEILNHSCDEAYLKETSEKVAFLHEYNKEDETCYEIVGLDKNNLSLIYTAKGNVLSFKKSKAKLN
jgi:hypothetical protein